MDFPNKTKINFSFRFSLFSSRSFFSTLRFCVSICTALRTDFLLRCYNSVTTHHGWCLTHNDDLPDAMHTNNKAVLLFSLSQTVRRRRMKSKTNKKKKCYANNAISRWNINENLQFELEWLQWPSFGWDWYRLPSRNWLRFAYFQTKQWTTCTVGCHMNNLLLIVPRWIWRHFFDCLFCGEPHNVTALFEFAWRCLSMTSLAMSFRKTFPQFPQTTTFPNFDLRIVFRIKSLKSTPNSSQNVHLSMVGRYFTGNR